MPPPPFALISSILIPLASIEGALKNLNELNRWVYYDNDKGDISDKTMREYDNLIELIKYQLEDIKYKK